jgi:hypothetical protein
VDKWATNVNGATGVWGLYDFTKGGHILLAALNGALTVQPGADLALNPVGHVTLGGGTHTTDAGDYDLRYDAADGITYDTSDARQKLNKVGLDYGLAKIMAITPYRYDYHVGHKLYDEDGQVVGLDIAEESYPSIGFIAQEIQSEIPEMVTEPPDDTKEFWATRDAILLSILVNAVKELNTKFEGLKAAVKYALETTPESYHLFKEELLNYLNEE